LRLFVPIFALLGVGCASAARQGFGNDPFVSAERALVGHQLSFNPGLRSFVDDDFGRIQEQLSLSLDYIEPMGLGPLRLEGGLHYSYDEADGTFQGQDVRLRGRDFELSAGVNYSFFVWRFRPYVGAGAAYQFFNLSGIDEEANTEFDDDDGALGGYVKAGVLFQTTHTSHVGLEVRHFEGGEATLDGTDLDSSYDQVALVFGSSFD
jgi:hypothetical protein